MAARLGRLRVRRPGLSRLQALRYPNFRWFWISTSGQAMAQGMQFLILGWLVLDLTGSTSQLGLTIFFYGIPNLTLVLFGGIFADRINRKKLLLFSQFGVTVIMFVVAALEVTDLVAVWQIYTASFLLGTLHAINMPTRLAMVVNLVEREDIMNAVVLNAAVMNAGRIIGPAIAGFIIDLTDLGPALFVNASGYLAAAACILMIRNFVQDRPDSRRNILGDLRDGLVYFGKTPVVFTIVGIGFTFGFFGMPHVQVMPAFAREVLDSTAAQAGLLMTAAGIGSLAANVVLALLGNFRKKHLLLIGALLLFEAALFAFAWSHWFWVSWGHAAVRGHGQHRLHIPGHHHPATFRAPGVAGAGDEPVVRFRRVHVHRLPAHGPGSRPGKLAHSPGRRRHHLLRLHVVAGNFAAHAAKVGGLGLS